MRYKPQMVSLMRNLINTKAWTPHCVRVEIVNKLPMNISCTHDEKQGPRTCLFCCAKEARDSIQNKLEDSEVWPIPLYDVYTHISNLCKKTYNRDKSNITKEEALALLDVFDSSTFEF